MHLFYYERAEFYVNRKNDILLYCAQEHFLNFNYHEF